MTAPSKKITRPTIFICDLQERFRNAIHEFPKIIATTQKLLKASQILDIPVVATTQLRGKLGETCPELNLDAEGPHGIKTLVHADKSRFSMWTPEVQQAVASLDGASASTPPQPRAIAIVGIETHICVTQTTLDLLAAGHTVYVLADGVSSCNSGEIGVALARLRAAGAVVTTSESWLYEVMGDAAISEFRSIAGLVKETTAATKDSVQTLCRF